MTPLLAGGGLPKLDLWEVVPFKPPSYVCVPFLDFVLFKAGGGLFAIS